MSAARKRLVQLLEEVLASRREAVELLFFKGLRSSFGNQQNNIRQWFNRDFGNHSMLHSNAKKRRRR